MNKTVALVNEWAEYEIKHPDASLEDFCRYYLISKREQRQDHPLFDGLKSPPRPDLTLSKLMGRIMSIFDVYAQEAVRSVGLKRPGDFYFLGYIAQMENPRKTEVIYNNICELSTGLAILESLKTQGYIEEHEDPDDKRSKRIRITDSGTQLLFQCYDRFGKIGEMMFGDIAPEDLELCVQLIRSVDARHMALWQFYKGKPFSEIYSGITGKEDISQFSPLNGPNIPE